MELIERYLQAVGRALPATKRTDILAELRSSLYDALDSAGDGEPPEESVVALLQTMGSPEKVAASYYPAGQYLIGPSLYPTFRMVIGIVFTVIIGLQLLAVLTSIGLWAGQPVTWDKPWRIVTGVLESLPGALGSVVVVFWLLQQAEVKFTRSETFDPRKLPAMEAGGSQIRRGEQGFSIVVNVVMLVFLARFAQDGGFSWIDGSGFFENPVIERYFPWVSLSIVVGIVIEIVLLWRGRWQRWTRIATIGSNLFGLGVLTTLIHGHNTWLEAAGVPGIFSGMDELSKMLINDQQIAGMVVIRAVLVFIALATLIETLVCVYRLVRPRLRPTILPPATVISSN
ncbi:MAG: hypothetical protein H0T53_09270 [Herpetosiphonaceae bacterium]|nr:hypothetical protein [Herpetosiphonaceae bacterium]